MEEYHPTTQLKGKELNDAFKSILRYTCFIVVFHKLDNQDLPMAKR